MNWISDYNHFTNIKYNHFLSNSQRHTRYNNSNEKKQHIDQNKQRTNQFTGYLIIIMSKYTAISLLVKTATNKPATIIKMNRNNIQN